MGICNLRVHETGSVILRFYCKYIFSRSVAFPAPPSLVPSLNLLPDHLESYLSSPLPGSGQSQAILHSDGSVQSL